MRKCALFRQTHTRHAQRLRPCVILWAQLASTHEVWGEAAQIATPTHRSRPPPSTAPTLSARPFSTSTSAPAFTSARTISECMVLTALSRAVSPNCSSLHNSGFSIHKNALGY
jgi:hypothetical protein